MSRWSQLVANLGRGGAVRTALLTVLFAAVGAVAAMVEGSPLPPLLLAVGLGLPGLLRRRLVERIEATSAGLRASGLFLAVGAFALGLLRGSAWDEGASAEWAIFAVLYLAICLHLGTTAWTFSDPEVVRID